jgi:hypothetical protein
MTARFFLTPLPILCATAFAGQPDGTSAKAITPDTSASRLRFGAAYAPLVGLKTEFRGLGTFNGAFATQPPGGGRNYQYDNGFVRVDSSGNLGGQTWNWGYENAGQYNPAGTGSIDMSISGSSANAGASDDNKSEGGAEFFAYLDMGAVGIPQLQERGATWGFRGGVHYAHVDSDDSSTLVSDTVTLVDRFDLGGNIAPLAPFTGSFAGPGPLMGDSPQRSYQYGQALVAGSRELDVHLTTLSFGTYLEMPLTRKFNVTLEGGLNAALASGSYDYQSATTITGLGTRQSSGGDSECSLLPGIYLGVSGIYQLNESWALQAAGRYQYLDGFDLESNGSGASLSFDSAFILSFGALYSF